MLAYRWCRSCVRRSVPSRRVPREVRSDPTGLSGPRTGHDGRLTELAIGRADGTYPKLLASLAKTAVLVIDGFGLTKPAPRIAVTCSRSSRTGMAFAQQS